MERNELNHFALSKLQLTEIDQELLLTNYLFQEKYIKF